jgi:hypothetical protein
MSRELRLSDFHLHPNRVISAEASDLYDITHAGFWRTRVPADMRIVGQEETLTFHRYATEKDDEGDVVRWCYTARRSDGEPVYCNVYND